MHTERARQDPATGRRTRAAWYAFDLGNTTVEFAIPLYLTLWIVNDLGVPAWLFGLASAVSSWAIGLSGPFIGVSADEKHRRKQWFAGSMCSSAALLVLLAFLPRSHPAGATMIVIAAMAANYLFQLCSLIYNASLTGAAAGANVVSVSSIGLGLSFLGGAVGIGFVRLVTSGSMFPGVTGRSYAIVPAALIFVACAIPSLFTPGLWLQSSGAAPLHGQSRYQRIKELLAEAARDRFAGWFLAGYFALNSAIMGLTLYLPLHVHTVTSLGDTGIMLMFGAVVITSALGAGFVAWLRPAGPMVRKVILVGLVLLAINCLLFSVAVALPMVVLCSCLHGLFSGALASTARGAFAQTFMADYQALAFGLFGAVQRLSQGLGAVLVPLVGVSAGDNGTRWGMGAMGVVAIMGIPFFRRWRLVEQTPHGAASSPSSSPARR
jgi:MFS-type transporter involved in bile tolerance (Atg22 family)